MSIWTTLLSDEELEAEIAQTKAARSAILASKSYRIGDRELTRADLKEVENSLNDLAVEKRRREGSGAILCRSQGRVAR